MTTGKQQQQQDRFRFWQHGAIFLAACAVIVSRQPEALLHAQFYAEGGHVFYADAYNFGWWNSLFQVHTGYYQTMPRLSADLALLVPLSMAPLVLNLTAILFQALPVNLLLSSRASAWGTLRYRALLAGVYLALPNSWEVNCRIPNTQWLLAICALILLLAPTSLRLTERLFDSCILLLSGLSGPFCVPLLPISIFLAWRHRERWRWVRAGIVALTVVVQSWALLVVDPSGHANKALGASVSLFVRILGGEIYLGAFLGSNGIAQFPGLGPLIILSFVAIGATTIIAICFLRSREEMRMFLLFSAMLLFSSLISPSGSAPGKFSAWQQMTAGAGVRYWFLPTLSLAWSLIWCLQQPKPILRRISVALLCLMCIGIVRDWRYPAFQDEHFAESVSLFEAASAGTTVILPIDPEGWNMTLVKHSPDRWRHSYNARY